MKCEKIFFSAHAVKRMFERSISKEVIIRAIKTGEVIEEYPDDKPFPSVLVLGGIDGAVLHVVLALNAAPAVCHVITVYIPDHLKWNEDFRRRREK
jgi:hypothetical protein